MANCDQTVSDYVQQLRDNGLRITPQRRAILKVLVETKDHPDAEQLHRRVKRMNPGISLPTIYRTINMLEDHGIIHRHAFDGTRARYENSQADHHDHLIDVDSGEVMEFTSERIERLQKEVAASFGYELINHRLELYGRKIKPK